MQVRHKGAPPLGKGRVLEVLARQNVSLDEEYTRRRNRKGALLTNKHRHAVPAMQLLTLPPKFLDLREYQHRPRGQWLPLPSKARAKAKEGERPCQSFHAVLEHASFALKCYLAAWIRWYHGCSSSRGAPVDAH